MKKFLSISIFCIVFLFSGCYAGNLTGNIIVEKKLINPIIVDFVFIFDQPTMDEFKKIPSIQWFSKRNQYKMDFELTDKIQVLTYELVPGQKITIEKFRPKHRNEGVIIYASYLSSGDHRVVLKDYSKLNLFINKEDFLVKVAN